jgi:UDP-2,4-diacetamido-2,4,6-trideoxy-beta-L-altropyranose hydrolase
MKVIFRVDASNQIGTGHVMRCLTLAAKLPEAEFVCIETEGNLLDFISSKGFQVHVIQPGKANDEYCFHSKWLENHWLADAMQTGQISNGADWLVVDHYALDKRWENAVRLYNKKIMVIDDLADRQHECDLLLDQNYYQDMETRYDGLLPKSCVKLLGPKYALLRDEFIEAPKTRQFGIVKKIFVSFGGVDATNETGKVLEILKGKFFNITALTGSKNYQELKNKFGDCRDITLLERSEHVAKLMAESDLAIGAGGSTTWERCALGLPTIAWPVAENQVKILQDVAAYGALKLGSPKTLLSDILYLENHLKQYSQSGQNLVDCQGSERVIKSLT